MRDRIFMKRVIKHSENLTGEEIVAAVQDFRRELQSISAKIKEINKTRKFGGYPHLDPENIPNSIAI